MVTESVKNDFFILEICRSAQVVGLALEWLNQSCGEI